MTAKAQGKDRVVVFDEVDSERPDEENDGRDVRSIAHLKMLQSLARKLNRLNGVNEIGEAIVDELRILVDYHNCVRLPASRASGSTRSRSGAASRGPRTSRSRSRLGEGLTGHVAQTGKPMLVDNARESDICLQVAPTARPTSRSPPCRSATARA